LSRSRASPQPAKIRRSFSRPHRVAEHHFHVVAHRAEQDTNQVVSHDLDLAIAARLVHLPQRHVVGPAAVGTHRREGEDLRAGVAHRGFEPHPFHDLEGGAADVDRVAADAQLEVRSTSTGRWPRRTSQ